MNGVRRVAWAAGAPARALLIGSLALYRMTLGGWLGGQCRFYPSCSVYAGQAVAARGAVMGSALAAWRLLRCNPYGRGGVDPAPARHRGSVYDAIIQEAAR